MTAFPDGTILRDAQGRDERSAWAATTQQQIVKQWGTDAIYLCVLGEHYRAAVAGLPYVEGVIQHWTQQRRDRGMLERAIGDARCIRIVGTPKVEAVFVNKEAKS